VGGVHHVAMGGGGKLEAQAEHVHQVDNLHGRGAGTGKGTGTGTAGLDWPCSWNNPVPASLA
jgi:hypothetical protein